jgi:hypothetical protein
MSQEKLRGRFVRRVRRHPTYANVRATPLSALLTTAAVASLVLALAGCGSGGGATTTAESANGPAPDELVGSYEVTLRPSDLPPNPPPELTGSPDWRLEIANSGGPAGGRRFAITNKRHLLEQSDFGVEGDSIVLKQEECACGPGCGYNFYDNEYRYKLRGKSLSFTTVSNSCPDRVAETILTSRPWARLR